MPEFEDQQNEPYTSNTNYDQQSKRLAKRRTAEDRKQMVQNIAIGIVGLAFVVGATMIGLNLAKDGFQNSSSGSTYTDPYPQMSTPANPIIIKDSKLTKLPDYLPTVAGGLGGAAIVIGIGLFWYTSATRKRYIQFDKIGVLISDSPRAGEGDARFIPWGCLQSVDVIYPKKSAPTPQTEVMNEAFPHDPVVAFYVDDNSCVKIPWRDIVACCEPGTFINALKTWAPDAIGACVFPGQTALNKIDDNNYTQLWFKYYSTASERKRTGTLEEGDHLLDGRYTIAGKIGGGGQGTAYLAVDRDAVAPAPSEVVLKEYILPVHRGKQVLEQTIEKLQREANILRNIDHPNIVRMMTEFVEDHRGYLVMEYVGGKSLKELVAAEGKQPEHIVRQLAAQICSILEYLHGRNPPIIHRDLTPDNLILQDDGVVKLVDFNVAHQLESAATATVVGKHAYIPPEQFRGKPSERSDIYAFGCTMHYMLTGEEPEPLTVSKPREFESSVSEDLDRIIATCTTLDAGRRYANAAAIREALEQTDKGVKINISEKITT